MKIGILTQPLVNNYGGILQNFALQQVLKEMGHSPTTINFAHTPLKLSTPHFIASVSKRFLRRILGKKQEYLNPYKEDSALFAIDFEQQRFIKENIVKVDILKKLIKGEDFVSKFDAFIVGSDQIWRPKYSPNIQNYFLDFTEDEQIKIAYAASFGTESWEFSNDLTESAKNLLKDFDGISVREDSGVRLCKDYLECDAEHVLDPTLLLTSKDYIDSLSIENTSKMLGVSAYILDDNEAKISAISDISKHNDWVINKLGGVRNGHLQSIEQWLSDIKNSQLIITDSFHGTVFSILFHKPFVTFYNPDRGNSRMMSLLKSVGLEEHLVTPDNIGNALTHSINWEEVDHKLNDLRSKSMQFLKSRLHAKKSTI